MHAPSNYWEGDMWERFVDTPGHVCKGDSYGLLREKNISNKVGRTWTPVQVRGCRLWKHAEHQCDRDLHQPYYWGEQCRLCEPPLTSTSFRKWYGTTWRMLAPCMQSSSRSVDIFNEVRWLLGTKHGICLDKMKLSFVCAILRVAETLFEERTLIVFLCPVQWSVFLEQNP